MSIYHRKVRDWLLFKPTILVEAMMLNKELADSLEQVALESYLTHMVDDTFKAQQLLTQAHFKTLSEYCLTLEDASEGMFCAFDLAEEIATLVKDGISPKEIYSLPPSDYLDRMGWTL